MVNNNIQGAIPLAGKGHSFKKFGDYEPGEFFRLVNAEITNEGRIVGRRPVEAMGDNGTTDGVITSYKRLLGTTDTYTLICNATEQKALTAGLNTTEDLWPPTDLPVPVGGWHNLEAFFRYNRTDHWLSFKADLTGNTCTVQLTRDPLQSDGRPDGTLTYAYYDTYDLFTITGQGGVYYFNNCLIQGDRLWIATNEGVYFSKVTDPSVFAAPDGGFFKFPGQEIQHIVSLADSIYVLCRDSVHVITYSSDPNSDATVRKIADVGARHGTIFRDTPYFVNAQGIYAITSLSVELVFNFEGIYFYSNYFHIDAWEDYLVLTVAINDYKPDQLDGDQGLNSLVIDPYFNDAVFNFEDYPYPCIFFNMNSGAAHAVDFKDQYDGLSSEWGMIVSTIVNTTGDQNVGPHLVFLTESGSTDHRLYAMFPTSDNRAIVADEIWDTLGNKDLVLPNPRIELRSYCPDGNNYMMKKFRTCEIMGNFGDDQYFIKFFYDRDWENHFDLTTAKDLTYDAWADDSLGPNRYKSRIACRFGLNQRAYAINIQIGIKDPFSPYVPDEADQERTDGFLIEDIRVLWSYVGRAQTQYSPTPLS